MMEEDLNLGLLAVAWAPQPCPSLTNPAWTSPWDLFLDHLAEELVFGGCLAAKSCSTLGDPTDCSPPGSSIHGLFQARILEWVAISFSRGYSWPRDWTRVSCTAGRFLTNWVTTVELIQQTLRISIATWLHTFLFSKDIQTRWSVGYHTGRLSHLFLPRAPPTGHILGSGSQVLPLNLGFSLS